MNPDEILEQLDLDELLETFDRAANQLLEVARKDGHFEDRTEAELAWPASASIDTAGLRRRLELISRIYEGTPSRRASRLAEAHEKYLGATPGYRQASLTYLQVSRQFVAAGAGSERDLLDLYQSRYLLALGRDNPFPLDAGEAALVELNVARAPLSHAQSVAEKLKTDPADDDPRWDAQYSCGNTTRRPLSQILDQIAERVVDYMAAGEHLAIRYNTFSNFVWFGISVWKAVSELELTLAILEGRVRQRWHEKLGKYVLLAQAMLLKFLEAHSEDPAQIRPKDYWYGQEYSYLTRDMIDLTTTLIDRANALARRARGERPVTLTVPPLLSSHLRSPGSPVPDPPGGIVGPFLEYRHVGRQGTHSLLARRWRLLRWLQLFRRTGRRKMQLHRSSLSGPERIAASWQNNTEWGTGTLKIFGITVRVEIDPLFAETAAELELGKGGRKIIFFPTHQSLLDHPVIYHVLQSPEMMAAMGWVEPVPCVIFSRSQLMDPTSFKIGSRQFSLIGVSPEMADRLLEEVDGYVIADRTRDAGNPIQTFAKLLQERPGVIYGAGTTAAFGLQCLPIQHALFAHLPADVVIIPMAFRGIHSLWPKCPKGNLEINPGQVEVVVSPPIVGATTLLPRKRALRTQLEPATLFQAIHIASLLDPESV